MGGVTLTHKRQIFEKHLFSIYIFCSRGWMERNKLFTCEAEKSRKKGKGGKIVKDK